MEVAQVHRNGWALGVRVRPHAGPTDVPHLAPLAATVRRLAFQTGISGAPDRVRLGRCRILHRLPTGEALRLKPGLGGFGGHDLGLELLHNLRPHSPDLAQPRRFVRHGLGPFDAGLLVLHVAFHRLER